MKPKTETQRLSPAEWALIEMIRTRPTVAVQVIKLEDQVIITVTDDPRQALRSRAENGIGADFEAAWRALAVALPGIPDNEE